MYNTMKCIIRYLLAVQFVFDLQICLHCIKYVYVFHSIFKIHFNVALFLQFKIFFIM